ncbi:hypothetical protein BX666DRAFT_579014 [Dichotomocladium elegans]|nr:hypothetical protein BX666DRAFT_579014 [Dichotomocladium elegans]
MPEYIDEQESVLEPYQRTRRRSRSRSLSRSASITSLSNFFSSAGSRSRSTSPSRHQAKPESSRSSPTSGGRTTPKDFFSTFTRKSRSRSSSMTSGGDKSVNSAASSTTTMATEILGTENDTPQQSRSNDTSKYGLPSSLVLADILTRRPLGTVSQEGKLSADVTKPSPTQINNNLSGGPPPPGSNPFMTYRLPETERPLRIEKEQDFNYPLPYSRRMSSRRGSRSPPSISTMTEGEADNSLSSPSSQNSTRSSTPSFGFSHLNRTPSPHSNMMASSIASQSTRSSLSFDDYESLPKSTLPRGSFSQDAATDTIQKLQELLSMQGYHSGNGNTALGRPTTKNMPSMRLPERANGFVVSSIPSEPSRDRNFHPVADKYRALTGKVQHMKDSLEARAHDTDPEHSYTLCNHSPNSDSTRSWKTSRPPLGGCVRSAGRLPWSTQMQRLHAKSGKCKPSETSRTVM